MRGTQWMPWRRRPARSATKSSPAWADATSASTTRPEYRPGEREDQMKIVVLGSGIIGVTTAYYLGRSGHEVVVVDRQTAAGMETSFANAGQVSPGYSAPWAGPGVPIKAARWLLMKYRPFVLWPRPDPDLAVWLA